MQGRWLPPQKSWVTPSVLREAHRQDPEWAAQPPWVSSPPPSTPDAHVRTQNPPGASGKDVALERLPAVQPGLQRPHKGQFPAPQDRPRPRLGAQTPTLSLS